MKLKTIGKWYYGIMVAIQIAFIILWFVRTDIQWFVALSPLLANLAFYSGVLLYVAVVLKIRAKK